MERIKLYWESDAWRDYQIYCQLSHPNEIAGMGKIVIRDGKPVVTDIYLIDQEVSGGAADFDDDKYAAWYDEFYRANGNNPEELRLWWHTHPSMSVEFSSKDRNTISKVRGRSKWFVAVVINEKGDRQGELFASDPPFLPAYKITKEDFVIIQPQERVSELKKEFDEKVKKKTYTTTYTTQVGGRGVGFAYNKPGSHVAHGHWDYDEWEGWGGWRGNQAGTSAEPKHGGYNGLGPKNGGNGKPATQVPSTVDKNAPSLKDEKIEGVIPDAEILKDNVARDIIGNVKALLAGGKKS